MNYDNRRDNTQRSGDLPNEVDQKTNSILNMLKRGSVKFDLINSLLEAPGVLEKIQSRELQTDVGEILCVYLEKYHVSYIKEILGFFKPPTKVIQAPKVQEAVKQRIVSNLKNSNIIEARDFIGILEPSKELLQSVEVKQAAIEGLTSILKQERYDVNEYLSRAIELEGIIDLSEEERWEAVGEVIAYWLGKETWAADQASMWYCRDGTAGKEGEKGGLVVALKLIDIYKPPRELITAVAKKGMTAWLSRCYINLGNSEEVVTLTPIATAIKEALAITEEVFHEASYDAVVSLFKESEKRAHKIATETNLPQKLTYKAAMHGMLFCFKNHNTNKVAKSIADTFELPDSHVEKVVQSGIIFMLSSESNRYDIVDAFYISKDFEPSKETLQSEEVLEAARKGLAKDFKIPRDVEKLKVIVDTLMIPYQIVREVASTALDSSSAKKIDKLFPN